jgi:hypothetical protein
VLKWSGWGAAISALGVLLLLVAKFRALHKKTRSKLAAVRLLLQQLQEGTLFSPPEQEEEVGSDPAAAAAEVVAGEESELHQKAVTALVGSGDGDKFPPEIVVELKEVQKQQHCLLDFDVDE